MPTFPVIITVAKDESSIAAAIDPILYCDTVTQGLLPVTISSAAQEALVPDSTILSGILHDVAADKLAEWTVLPNTLTTCTFRIHVETVRPSYPSDLLIRLEAASGSNLAALAGLQALAHAQLPHLVPTVLHVGAVTDADGREMEDSITPYYTGTATLEEVWDTLGQDDQRGVVDVVVRAVETLQKAVCGQVGGPKLGYSPDVQGFLRGLPLRNCSLSEVAGGDLVLSSMSADIGQVTFSPSDLADLNRHVVFCHNDLEPRNIFVRSVAGRCEVAAIIDWEMAGF
ncbi:uncharacterized protein C8A04DRAFT_28041 [Dichotomopilus funicola]|uniref:Aminoglycoside phosphotransferase domain-containing protein n=1 Tax=Dichotomopilus funicola TaxID=1934379 RepID=A0AAN6V479_9PEZI|nr:hypothetical protein C8A04DRAFT_28041 [Dichotomopilus funicola]